MSRPLTIVGIGEIWTHPGPGGPRPEGLAADVPLAAARLGHRGVSVSRLGQDDPAHQLIQMLRAQGVDVDFLQSDPDLPTGRASAVRDGQPGQRRYDARAAFDMLQWDFDLEDVAHGADAIVFSLAARRHGQCSSTIDRLLTAAPQAVRVLDLGHRLSDHIDRAALQRAIGFAGIVMLDSPAACILSPAFRTTPPVQLVSQLVEDWGDRAVIYTAPDGAIEAASPRASARSSWPAELVASPAARCHLSAAIAITRAAGRSLDASLRTAAEVARWWAEQPDQAPARSLLDELRA